MRFHTKAQLLDSIRHEHGAFLSVAAAIPQDCYVQPGVWGDEWSIKDLYAHLTEWEQMFLSWYREGLAGNNPPRPAPGYKWNQTPALNRAIWQKHQHTPWRQVSRRFEASYEEILGLASSLTQAELLEPGHFPWTGRLPLASYLGPNSSSHYRTATKILKRWLKRKAVPPQAQRS